MNKKIFAIVIMIVSVLLCVIICSYNFVIMKGKLYNRNEPILIFKDQMTGQESFDSDKIVKFRNLESLTLWSNNVDNAEFLEYLDNLKSIELSTPNISDFTVMANCRELEYVSLFIKYNKITDLKFLYDNKKIRHISVYSDNLVSLDGLENAGDLEYLDAACINLKDISALQDHVDLKHVALHSTAVIDHSILNECVDLEYLDMSLLSKDTDLTFIKNMEKLEHLSISDNITEGYEVLFTLPNLKYVALKEGSISDDEIMKLESNGIYVSVR